MRIRKKTVCQECRDHKIGCDGKRPSCSQCLHTGRQCSGYPPEFTFVSKAIAKPSKFLKQSDASQLKEFRRWQAHVHKPIQRGCGTPISSIHFLPANGIQDLIDFIIRSYVPIEEIPLISQSKVSQSRICGSWVEVLPSLADTASPDDVLVSAIRAFAASIAAKQRGKIIFHSAPCQPYGSALSLLRRSLELSCNAYQDEQLATIMCLTLTELIIPTRESTWMVHADGVGEMMQLATSKYFSTGIPHRLFVGFRPLLVLKAIISRKSTFLEQEEWKTVPFQFQSPSSMQILLSHAADIPAILERVDLLGDETSDVFSSVANNLLLALTEVLQHFQAWSETFENMSPGPLYWLLSDGEAGIEGSHYWFSNVTVANALTHLWAFKAICLLHIRKLRLAIGDDQPDRWLQMECTQLATRIGQSIVFLLQDSLNLYGPSSVAFLLKTIQDINTWDGRSNQSRTAISPATLQYINQKGFYID